jgi:hypothetical protein
MTTRHRRFGASLPSLMLIAACQYGAAVDSRAASSEVRVPPTGEVTEDACPTGRIQVKLRDGSGVRLRDGQLVVVPALVDPNVPTAQLAAVVELLNGPRVRRCERMFSEPEAELDRLRELGEASTGQRLPDLNSWFVCELTDRPDGAALIAKLEQSQVIDSVQCVPRPPPPP